jgi:hypothetical protein
VACHQSYIDSTDREVFHSKIVQVETQKLTEDETGGVTGEHIRINGPLTLAWRLGKRFWDDKWEVKNKTIRLELRFDLNPRVSKAPSGMTSFDMSEPSKVSLRVGGDVIPHSTGEKIFLLPIRSDTNVEHGALEMSGLVLSPCKKAKERFIRIGVFIAEHEDDHQAFKSSSDEIEEKYYETLDGVNGYTITII